MFAFNENDKWDSKHNFEAFGLAVIQFAACRRNFPKFRYVYGKCVWVALRNVWL